MNKYLVTGGAGFIGSHLCELFLKRGEKVVCLDNFDDFYDPKIKRKNISTLLKNSNFSLIEADIRDVSKLNEIAQNNKFDIIFHLAARAGVRPSLKMPLLYEEVNVKGTTNLLEVFKDKNIKKIIFSSSSSVYGNNKKVPFSETDNVDKPISFYASTKKACELICHTYHHLYGMPVACVRIFTAYGPRQRPEMAIHKFIRLISEGSEIQMFGDGTTKRDYTYIDDLIVGLEKLINKDFGYEIYNLGESKTVELKYLIELIEKALNKKAKIKQLPKQPGDVDVTYADITKAKRELGYNPKVNIEEGIEKFVKWFLDGSRGL